MRVSASLVRGGTSKCWLFDHADVPSTMDGIAELLVNAYGAADPRQLDGVGGATPTTSKAAVIRPSERAGVDVEYLFAQVGIGANKVEWGSNCGNCATAIALWSVSRGLVPITGDRTKVVLRNTNTGAILTAEVDTTGGRVREFGEQTVPGSRCTGVRVELCFLDPAGTGGARLLPSGSVTDSLAGARVSMVDAGAPMVLVDATTVGRTGADELARVRADVPWLRDIRYAGAELMGITTGGDASPKVGYLGPPAPYRSTTGEEIGVDEHDLAVRMLSMNDPHPAIGLTSAVGIAIANLLPGSVVHEHSAAAGSAELRIGTPGGVLRLRCAEPHQGVPRKVSILRAARILCEAKLSVPESAAAVPV